ncbi:DUF2892 domain-containing protein [Fodinisporobacter ferrooxydans]|uniref:DUF2892 domain-containing protein n=1 Tax=Fodinisporobacter ferrooxydans TaxID=2901836 RepID=A0ABY4CS53_9BACL|nr:DUF2892 domain-containing protein [Alicyclobacillaceae bacterium MYW30-H2]
MIKQNVGTWDAYTRLVIGLTALGCGIGRSVRRRDLTSYFLIAGGAIKVAEGITRVCPLLYSMGISTTEKAEISPTVHLSDKPVETQEAVHD